MLLAACLGLFLLGLSGCASGGTVQDTTTSEPSELVAVDASDTSSGVDADTNASGMDFEYSKRDLDSSYDDATATHVLLTGTTATVDGLGAVVDGSVVTITDEGTYVVSGELDNGQLVVETADDVKVQVVLADATIHNDNGPALYVKQTDKCFVTLAEGTHNTLTDGSEYVLEEGTDEPDATLFSKSDLAINGSGALSVTSSYCHAICSKDDLIITEGTYVIDAFEDALRGRDCVKICGGTFSITATGDGIKSNNDEDATRGFVAIDSGTFDIEAGDDGVQAYTFLRVTGGVLDLNVVDDALHSDGEALIAGGTFAITAGDDAVHAESVLTIDDGTVDVVSCYEGYEAEKIYINGGETHMTADDDAINAASAETAVTSDDATVVTGTVDEATGTTNSGAGVTPQDGFDGANTAMPPAGESANERMLDGGVPQKGMAEGGGMGMGDENCLIQINGGYLYIDAAGDGIDSNGSVEITGGVVLVCGPVDSANGFFDYDLTSTVSGGTVLMVGSAGMAQNFTTGTQPFAFASTSGGAGQNVAVVDDSGQVLASFTSPKQFDVVLASSPSFVEGGEYSIIVGGTASGANADGYAEGGTVSGGSTTSITASSTATGGMGGMGAGGGPMGAGQGGAVQRGMRGGM